MNRIIRIFRIANGPARAISSKRKSVIQQTSAAVLGIGYWHSFGSDESIFLFCVAQQNTSGSLLVVVYRYLYDYFQFSRLRVACNSRPPPKSLQNLQILE